MKVSKSHLLQLVLVVFAVGMITGLLLHYVDHGFPTPRHWLAWPMLSVSYGFMILYAIAEFFAITSPSAAVGKE